MKQTIKQFLGTGKIQKNGENDDDSSSDSEAPVVNFFAKSGSEILNGWGSSEVQYTVSIVKLMAQISQVRTHDLRDT